MKKLIHLIYWLFKARSSGLKPLERDTRDYRVEELGWFGYTPKYDRHIIKTLSIKDQKRFQTCQWESSTVQKEVDEKIVLSPRSLVIKGKQMELVGRRGLSDLRAGQKVLKKWGILPESVCPSLNRSKWNEYINFNVDAHTEVAARHKIKSYWFINKLDDVYRLLDKGRAIVVGTKWYSGFNQRGGFKMPWIIDKIIGWYVGGHSVSCIGYDRNYNGKKVLIMQNTYSSLWGDKGKLYVEENYFVKNYIGIYGAVVNLDEDAIDEPWIKDAEALYNRVKSKYVFIMRADLNGELYELNEKGLNYIPLYIGSDNMKQLFNSWLKSNDKFIGISENDFELLSKYLRLRGLKVGLKPKEEII